MVLHTPRGAKCISGRGDAFGNALGNGIVGHMMHRDRESLSYLFGGQAAYDDARANGRTHPQAMDAGRDADTAGGAAWYWEMRNTPTGDVSESVPANAGGGLPRSDYRRPLYGDYGPLVGFFELPYDQALDAQADAEAKRATRRPPLPPGPVIGYGLSAAEAGSLPVLGSGLAIAGAGILSIGLAARRFESFTHPYSFMSSPQPEDLVFGGLARPDLANLQYGDYTAAGGALTQFDWETVGRPTAGDEPIPLASAGRTFRNPSFSLEGIGDFVMPGYVGPISTDILEFVQDQFSTQYALLDAQYDMGDLRSVPGVSRQTVVGQAADAATRSALKAELLPGGIFESYADQVLVNQYLWNQSGTAYRIPDIQIPAEGVMIDYTVGYKDISTPQVRDFFQYSPSTGTVVIVTPAQPPLSIPRPPGI